MSSYLDEGDPSGGERDQDEQWYAIFEVDWKVAGTLHWSTDGGSCQCYSNNDRPLETHLTVEVDTELNTFILLFYRLYISTIKRLSVRYITMEAEAAYTLNQLPA